MSASPFIMIAACGAYDRPHIHIHSHVLRHQHQREPVRGRIHEIQHVHLHDHALRRSRIASRRKPRSMVSLEWE
jgi:hypothetical protein